MGKQITPIKDLPNVSFRGFNRWFSVNGYQEKATRELMKNHNFSSLWLDFMDD